MDDALSVLAAKYGIDDFYISATGEYRAISTEIKLGLLDAMGVDTIGVSPGAAFAEHDHVSTPGSAEALKCYVPDWLRDERVWGVTTQLYAVRSARNHGIGDFEDLARLAEMAAARGADFVGVNPLHALFWDDPDRCSPYFPTSRQFINPLYIAIDALPGGADALNAEDPDLFEGLRRAPTVDYRGVSRLKHRLLRDIFQRSSPENDANFQKFCNEHSGGLEGFARFETISALMGKNGILSGWPNWPEEFQRSNSEAVANLLAGEEQTILWHKWMQWVSHDQLARAQQRALSAGMRIGLYLDIAVGVAPDGAATWSDPSLVTSKARIGCPPDAFNPLGQDWGLAPIIPSALHDRGMGPFEDVIGASTSCAGAVRIDHAMALDRLYWIPDGRDAREGGYVRYPREAMLDVLSAQSQRNQTIIIGEDLGTVPGDFRDIMQRRAIHSYRVFYFERDGYGRFSEPQTYPDLALACIATHDLPPIRGWWSGADIATRLRLALITEDAAKFEELDRQQSRRQVLALLADNGAEHSELAAAAEEPTDALVADLHACIASGPSRLFAVQLEDLAAAREQINVPGTHTEYPNWRTKLPLKLEELFEFPLAVKTLDAIARVRTRRS